MQGVPSVVERLINVFSRFLTPSLPSLIPPCIFRPLSSLPSFSPPFSVILPSFLIPPFVLAYVVPYHSLPVCSPPNFHLSSLILSSFHPSSIRMFIHSPPRYSETCMTRQDSLVLLHRFLIDVCANQTRRNGMLIQRLAVNANDCYRKWRVKRHEFALHSLNNAVFVMRRRYFRIVLWSFYFHFKRGGSMRLFNQSASAG